MSHQPHFHSVHHVLNHHQGQYAHYVGPSTFSQTQSTSTSPSNSTSISNNNTNSNSTNPAPRVNSPISKTAPQSVLNNAQRSSSTSTFRVTMPSTPTTVAPQDTTTQRQYMSQYVPSYEYRHYQTLSATTSTAPESSVAPRATTLTPTPAPAPVAAPAPAPAPAPSTIFVLCPKLPPSFFASLSFRSSPWNQAALVSSRIRSMILVSSGIWNRSSGTTERKTHVGAVLITTMMAKFINLPVFQRLRSIKQLGTAYYVWAGASHNRFGHCIALQRSQPELRITDRDVQCVTLAGLCHDLGHGPWSHVWDGEFIPHALPNLKWTHEEASEMMLDFLIAQKKIVIPLKDVVFIKALIAGDHDRCKVERAFLFDIVVNKRNGLDVDKYDHDPFTSLTSL
ncbi:hypothetical protein BT96DRAFT_1006007 [Gymnopus androsaceus JB14]|uniref:Uncharacterized protein n=1 Tax=Gymnopus androsaceus JB14 TaxID=1447944 RepID=A0A6A4GMU1_9AGAR|nr:hypothetical protein BT96DRAFT_1006007 [Gymnopus androsaceus JB14]